MLDVEVHLGIEVVPVFAGIGSHQALVAIPAVQDVVRRRVGNFPAGSKLNWAALEAVVVDKIFFYYAPKILGGIESLPMAGGVGRRRRIDAIRLRDLKLHAISGGEFAVEGYVQKDY